MQRDEHGVIFEMTQQGAYMKVSAVCTRTGLEVSVVGPSRNADGALKQLALRKLQRALEQGRR